MTSNIENELRSTLSRYAEQAPIDPNANFDARRQPPKGSHGWASAAMIAGTAVLATGGLIAVNTAGGSDTVVESNAASAPADDNPAASVVEPDAWLNATEAVTIKDNYWVDVWDAREIVVGDCMKEAGFAYQARPNEAADAAGADAAWKEWDAWFTSQTDANPAFEKTMLGSPEEQAGGCQLLSYQVVHGPGEEAFSKMTDLSNELLAIQANAEIKTTQDRDTAASQWLTEMQPELEQMQTELDDEAAQARSIIESGWDGVRPN